MKFFIDTADVAEIKKLNDIGLVDGVTTNPSIIAKSGRDFLEVIKEICGIVEGDVSAEVLATETDKMLEEGKKLAKLASNVVVKLPLTMEGLAACKKFTAEGIKTNVTLCFSANQALLAAKCGATYISPFIGRLDDIGLAGMDLISDIRDIYDNYGFETQILAASIRHPEHVLSAALIGADVCTLPPKVVWQLAQHPLTEKGLADFLADWKASGKTL